MNSWFAELDLSGTSDAQQRVIRGVSDLLDELQPTRLDPAQQVVEREDGETWVKLQHDSAPWMEIRFVLSDGWVNFYGVMGHDEAYSPGRSPRMVGRLKPSTSSPICCSRRSRWRLTPCEASRGARCSLSAPLTREHRPSSGR